jgi:molybdopterin/thiamine biosynthesis adenylyltransferase
MGLSLTQTKLLGSSVLVIGAGGIDSFLLLYLAASGVGHVTIVDYDAVERSNLHRQIIHRDGDSSCGNDGRGGRNKAQSAKAAMLALNPTLFVTALDTMVDGDNIMELVSRHDVAVNALDNPRTCYLLNNMWCREVPWERRVN